MRMSFVSRRSHFSLCLCVSVLDSLAIYFTPSPASVRGSAAFWLAPARMSPTVAWSSSNRPSSFVGRGYVRAAFVAPKANKPPLDLAARVARPSQLRSQHLHQPPPPPPVSLSLHVHQAHEQLLDLPVQIPGGSRTGGHPVADTPRLLPPEPALSEANGSWPAPARAVRRPRRSRPAPGRGPPRRDAGGGNRGRLRRAPAIAARSRAERSQGCARSGQRGAFPPWSWGRWISGHCAGWRPAAPRLRPS